MGESRLPDSTRESHSNDSQDDALDKDSLDGEETNSGDQQATLLNGGWVVEVERKQRLHRIKARSHQAIDAISGTVCGWLRKELIVQLKLCFPIVLTWFFQNLLAFVSLIFVGHISGQALELDSVALATSFINVTGLSVGIGLSSAADTLCSQSFGYKNYKHVGHILQQGILILLVVCLFVWGAWLNTDNMLLLLQQSPCVSRYAGYYTQIFTICLPAFFVYVMLQKYLQSQSRVWPFIIVGALANIINVILHSILLLWLDLGIFGAAISMVVSNIFQPVFLIVYIRILKLHTLTWGGWSWESIRGWWQFLKLGIPGMAMICLEWVSYEIVVFVLGSIGEVELAINSILVNLLVIMFMLPLGISITAGIRVGNALGANKPTDAKRTAYVSLLLVVINTTLQLIFLQCIKTVIGSIYTREQAVLDKIPFMINIITPGLFFDQVQVVIQGVLRGCGLQTLGAIINFFAFYCFGLPLGISLAFKANMGVAGMWIGLMSATTSQCMVYMIIVLRMNWKKQAEKAQERVSAGDAKVNNAKEEHIASSVEEVPLTVMGDKTIQENKLEDTIVDSALKTEECESKELLLDENHDIVNDQAHNNSLRSSHVKLLLSKGSLFLIGVSFVVIAVFTSFLEVPESVLNGNYSECMNEQFYDDMSSTSNIMPSPTPIVEWTR